jgi:MoxR-like ATPase
LAEPAVAPAPADLVAAITANLAGVVHAPKDTLRLVVLCLVAEGHLIIEDFPGVGKTMLAKALARSLDCSFSRLQFTPDLLPSDVTGVNVFSQKTNEFEFRPGPVFANLLLVDEVNRASPKTQSALLECMQESQVTVDGVTYPLERPFMAIATQNPIEYEGTYPLPEAQLDRFLFKLRVPYPGAADLHDILDRTTQGTAATVCPVVSGPQILEMRKVVRTVPVAPHVQDYVVKLTLATHPENRENLLAGKYIRYGSSPRGAQTLILGGKVRALLDGRYNVSMEDIRALMLPALRHRIILNFEAQADGRAADDLLEEIAGKIAVK